MGAAERAAWREAIREMFSHAWDGYLAHGFPASEPRPTSRRPLLLSCDETIS
jgi:hypothetical protein